MSLIQEVRMMKALHNIKYSSIATALGINSSSFYNWLRGEYQFSAEREQQLKELIEHIKEGGQDDGCSD